MKRIICALSLVLALSACTKSDPVREALVEKSNNLATVSDVTYDDLYSTSSLLSVFWVPDAAIEAGASSFTIVVSEEMFEFTDEDGASNALTFSVRAKDLPNNAIMISNGLVAGTGYYVKIAAVYPGPAKSEWVYLLGPDGKPAKVVPGVGII